MTATIETLHLIPPGVAREDFLPLLLLADESEVQVRSYMQQGGLYAFGAGPKIGDVAGVVLAIPEGDTVVELKAVAIHPAQQGRGIGKRMVLAVLDDLRARGVERVTVGTGNAGIGQLAFYQRTGFRLVRIERDFFSPERGYPEVMEENGIRLRDMVWMEQRLGNPSERYGEAAPGSPPENVTR